MEARTRKEIKKYMRQAIIEAKKAAMELESSAAAQDLAALRHENAALAHAGQALSFVLSAETVYISGAGECEWYEFECIVQQAKAFVRELTANFERNRGHEWSLIEHEKLMQEIQGTEFEFEL